MKLMQCRVLTELERQLVVDTERSLLRRTVGMASPRWKPGVIYVPANGYSAECCVVNDPLYPHILTLVSNGHREFWMSFVECGCREAIQYFKDPIPASEFLGVLSLLELTIESDGQFRVFRKQSKVNPFV